MVLDGRVNAGLTCAMIADEVIDSTFRRGYRVELLVAIWEFF